MLFISHPFLKSNEIRIDDFCGTASEVRNKLYDTWGVGVDDVYLLYNGKPVADDVLLTNGIVQVVPRLVGGKGGFGSMLRAIGAQIEKTTNREACRDLSGRRLRDINEEKRLKNWIALQAEREKETAERRRKKLERLCREPKHNFHDETYEKDRSQLTDKVCDAVEQGFKCATTSTGNGNKRKASSATTSTSNKKRCMWMDSEEEDLSSGDSSADENDCPGSSSKGVESSDSGAASDEAEKREDKKLNLSTEGSSDGAEQTVDK